MLCTITVGSPHSLLPPASYSVRSGRRPLRGCVASPSSDKSGARLFDESVIQRLYPSHIYGTKTPGTPGSCTLPPMGWNSWNTLAENVSEDAVKENAELLVTSGLSNAGYKYVNVDDCWQGSRRAPDGTITADAETFPSGIKALADYVHSLGLKFGIYSDAGHKTCAGRPGSWGYEEVDAATYADWGVDYIKYDNCFNEGLPGPKVRYSIMRNAIDSAGRPVHFNMCEWGEEDPATWAGAISDSWRTTVDIEPSWAHVTHILQENDKWAAFAGPGGFNDADMLEVGVPGNNRGPGLTEAEERSHFVLWALMKSPLMIGADLRCIPSRSLELLLNQEVIAINQDPLDIQGRLAYHEPGNPDAQVWAVPLQSGAAAVALFNAGEEPAQIALDFRRLGCCYSVLQDGQHKHQHPCAVSVRDLLSHSELGTFSCCCAPMPPAPGTVPAHQHHHDEIFAPVVAPHDVILLRLELYQGMSDGVTPIARVAAASSLDSLRASI